MFYAKVFFEFLFVFLYLIMCIVFKIHPCFLFFLYLILFCAVLEDTCKVRKGPMDMHVERHGSHVIIVCPAGH